ncbi:isochorismatase family protein [Massilia sp. W12]|uniref:isochorismatase family protein n=1 Tax=Massilia sp. W12 TaxID=3126507 RepID=UPI0030D15777
MSIPPITPYPMPASMPAARASLPLQRWQLAPQRAVLLVHDMQEYFLDAYNRTQEPAASLLAHVQQLLAVCEQLQIPVVFSAQPAQQSLAQRGLLQDWWGSGLTARPQREAIAQELQPLAAEQVMTKWRYSAFARTDLEARMGQRDQLIICGIYAHIGCMMTAADAFMRDKQVFFAGDAVADFSLAEHQLALDWVAKRAGIVLTCAQLCRQLQRAALTPDLPGFCGQLAQALDLPPQAVQADSDLLALGMDSVRLMQFLSPWQAAGAQADLLQLASQPTPAAWWRLLHNSFTEAWAPAAMELQDA